MVTDFLGMLLSELSRSLKMNLKPDVNNSCLINYSESLQVQMEMSKDKKFFIIGCIIGEIPPGRFRLDVFREALRYNGTHPPHVGSFAYSDRKDVLIFQRLLPIEGLTGDKITTLLPSFTEKAKQWQTDIVQGRIPSDLDIVEKSNAGIGGGLFGLKR